MKKILLMLLPIALAAFSACNPVERDFNQMEDMVVDAEENGSSYTNEDWENFINDYEAYQEDISEYQEELTQEDYEQYGRLTARYHKVVLKYAVETFKSGVDAGGSIMKGYIDEMNSDGSIQNSIDELDVVAEDASDKIDELSDEIDELFE